MRKFLRMAVAGLLATVMLIITATVESILPEQGSTESADTYMNEILGMENPEDMISLQDSMRAVFMTPEVDFSISDDGLSDIFNEVLEYGLNAVIINTSSEDDIFYNFDMSEQDNLNNVIDLAHNAGLYVYLTLDCGKMIEDVIEQGGSLKKGFSAQVHKFTMKYSCEGILLTNYYTQDNVEMYAEYLYSGSGIGYENWLYEINEFIIRTISEIIHETRNTTAVGLLIENMWANKSSNEDGSDTLDTVEALYDGFCDTKKYVESKYVDFNIVKAYGSTESNMMNFESIVSWWFELDRKYDVKTYVCHINERIGNCEGWNDDQLLRQLAVMEKMDGIGGSAFNSFKTFQDNPLNSTNTLLKYFNDQINTQTL